VELSILNGKKMTRELENAAGTGLGGTLFELLIITELVAGKPRMTPLCFSVARGMITGCSITVFNVELLKNLGKLEISRKKMKKLQIVSFQNLIIISMKK